ncbi:DNA-processing protein DprA [bacterium]|nr:DNA-processing protein DprA [bacterium]
MSPKVIDPEILLTLSSIHGIGPSKLRTLVSRFGSTFDVIKAPIRELISVNGIDATIANNIKNCRRSDFAKDQLRRMEQTETRLVSFWDKEYPGPLKHIYDPPAFLFIRGAFKNEDKYSVSVVGTRKPSNYGKLVTERLTSEIARNAITIVSGLAYGVDTLAHSQALQSGARTIAVLGSGVDVIYPSENRALADRIMSNGAVISEFPMGADPDRNNFPRRNRIICGLSLGTLVIEAGAKSGALITAAMALDQDREVFAVPGNIDSPNSIGTNELIKQGARIVTSAADILDELAPQLGSLVYSGRVAWDESNLNDDERALFALLDHEPKHVDVLASRLDQSTSQILSTLLSLELKNAVKQLAGKYFVKA